MSTKVSVLPGGRAAADATEDLFWAVQRYVDKVVAPLREKLIAQEAEIKALKERPDVSGFIDHRGHLMLSGGSGAVRDAGLVVGKDGEPGKDGLSFDAFMFEPEYDGERTIRLRWSDAKGNEQVRGWQFPMVLYQGVWKADRSYEIGDACSRGGSLWIAKTSTTEPPEESNRNWVLAVKRGRDGRDGKDGVDGKDGKGFTE
jgi:hypothetical protein